MTSKKPAITEYPPETEALRRRIADLESELELQSDQLADDRGSEALFRTVVESAQDIIFIINQDLRLTYINPIGERFGMRVMGCSREDFLNAEIPSFLISKFDHRDTSSLKTGMERIRRAFDSSEPVYHESFIPFPGESLWLGTWLHPVIDNAGHVTSVVGISREVTKRRQTEENLRRSEERLAVTLASIGEAVVTTDTTDCVVTLNNAAKKLTGWNEIDSIGQPVDIVCHLVDETTHVTLKAPIKTLLLNDGAVPIPPNEATLIARNGCETLVSFTCAPIRRPNGLRIGAVLAFRDISRQRAFEEEMHRVQKLESVGILAGGIAHDFNNILTAVMGNLSLAQRRVGKNEAVLARLEDAEKAVTRARDLTNQLLTFSQGGAPIKTVASAKTIIEESAEFALSGSSAKCEISIPDDLWSVEVDEGQIAQVIQNLVINADQAMASGGTVHISAKNLDMEMANGIPIKPGRYVRISVRDQGIGIADENLDQVFDPYFTTKKDGTGLGLATTYSIMRRHGGHVTVESTVEIGTTFHLFVPATEKRASGSLESVKPNVSGSGRILVMDDDPTIREIAAEMLRDLGYEVELVTCGEDAIVVYRKRLDEGKRFDAVIMDLTIPGGIGGKEAIELLRRVDPAVKAIVSSGYSNDPIMSNFQEYGFAGMVTKPYGVSQLTKALFRVIGKR